MWYFPARQDEIFGIWKSRNTSHSICQSNTCGYPGRLAKLLRNKHWEASDCRLLDELLKALSLTKWCSPYLGDAHWNMTSTVIESEDCGLGEWQTSARQKGSVCTCPELTYLCRDELNYVSSLISLSRQLDFHAKPNYTFHTANECWKAQLKNLCQGIACAVISLPSLYGRGIIVGFEWSEQKLSYL